MTGIDFPSNPSVNQQFSAFGNVWIWNGSSWRKVSRTAVVGAQGNTGQTGSQGPAGAGAQGAAGPAGAQGNAGGSGPAGAQGAVGAQGASGAQGNQGAVGAQGSQGTQGNIGVGSITTSTGAPPSPNQGDLWWDTDDGVLLVYYNDGNSSQWVSINTGVRGAQGATGSQGAAGAQGATGSTGAQGATNSNASGATGDFSVAEKIVHTGDTNTFIKFPDAGDIISMTVGNYEKFKIESGDITIPSSHLLLAADGRRIKLGAASDFQLSHTGTENIIQSYVGDIDYMSPNGSGHSFQINSVEKVRIDSSGELLVGTQNPINSSTSKFQVAATDATGSAILARFNASVYSSYLDFYKSRSNTLGTAYVVNDDDHLGAIRYYAADGSNSGYTTAAEIYGSCDGGSGAAGDMPGRITFHTRPDGAGQSMQERLRIDSVGRVQICLLYTSDAADE